MKKLIASGLIAIAIAFNLPHSATATEVIIDDRAKGDFCLSGSQLIAIAQTIATSSNQIRLPFNFKLIAFEKRGTMDETYYLRRIVRLAETIYKTNYVPLIITCDNPAEYQLFMSEGPNGLNAADVMFRGINIPGTRAYISLPLNRVEDFEDIF